MFVLVQEKSNGTDTVGLHAVKLPLPFIFYCLGAQKFLSKKKISGTESEITFRSSESKQKISVVGSH